MRVHSTSLPVYSCYLQFLDQVCFLPFYLSFSNTFKSQSNVIVAFLSAGAMLFTRAVGVAYCVLGAVMCSLSVKLLKNVIRQPRPPHTSQQKVTYGFVANRSSSATSVLTHIFAQDAQYTLSRDGLLHVLHFPLLLLPPAISLCPSGSSLGHGISRGVSAVHYLDCAFKGLAWTSYLASSCSGNNVRDIICARMVHNVV
jgi:dolichyldiphosphatase